MKFNLFGKNSTQKDCVVRTYRLDTPEEIQIEYV